MNIIQPSRYQQPPELITQKSSTQRVWWWLAVPVVIVLLLGYNVIRPLPAATATITVSGLANTRKPTIKWPSFGQAAIGSPDYNVLATNAKQTPLATASIAKVILALCVLDKQPLQKGQSGPTYIVTAGDVAIYNKYVSQNGSVAAVAENEKLTEYQALEALMIPSANNIADSLAAWVFGSTAGYSAYAANYLANNLINETTIGTDASGYSPTTTSTASDLTKIGLLALKSPVLMEIAGKKSTTLPIAGLVNNYDTILGVNGITGLKTGNNDQDPGAFLFTADLKVGTQTVKATGAVMGAPDLQSALDASTKLSASMQQSFEQVTITKAGEQVGTMRTAWGASSPIVTTNKLQVVRWQSTAFAETHTLRPSRVQGNVGDLQVHAPGSTSRTNLSLQHTIPGPSFWWRLTRH
jgi:serine-type D-Ala-D-Ala carboxypeptidase (penicillin-binding protein 5/6)